MIKKLRVKFVCIVMGIVTVMLIGILGVVIHFTAQNMQVQSLSMMRAISNRPFQQGDPGRPLDDEVRLPYFVVKVGIRGDLQGASGGYFDLSDKDDIQRIVNAALESRKETGELREYRLRFLITSAPGGYSMVFSDTTNETAILQNMFYSCLLIFVAASAAFLGVSILLSQWVVKPVAVAWELQRQFVADASHELKTPLAVIMANAELIQSDDTGEEERRRFSKDIQSMTYQMRSLVENMLEMARVDNGAVQIEFTTVDLSQLTTDSVLSFQLLFEEKGLGLESEISNGIMLSGSERHLFQVLDILLDNALKYSAPQGTVRLRLSQSGRGALLSVSSPGEQISQEDLKNIFKRFYRTDKARAMNGSYGLGLSIAESIVQIHKGKIWAQSSKGENTFFVQLPMHNSHT